MPRYYFHTADGAPDHDEVGTELADDNAARVEAVRYIGESLRSDPKLLWDGSEFRVEVTDENGDVLFTVVALSVDCTSRKVP
jgi:hypothetical protein